MLGLEVMIMNRVLRVELVGRVFGSSEPVNFSS